MWGRWICVVDGELNNYVAVTCYQSITINRASKQADGFRILDSKECFTMYIYIYIKVAMCRYIKMRLSICRNRQSSDHWPRNAPKVSRNVIVAMNQP